MDLGEQLSGSHASDAEVLENQNNTPKFNYSGDQDSIKITITYKTNTGETVYTTNDDGQIKGVDIKSDPNTQVLQSIYRIEINETQDNGAPPVPQTTPETILDNNRSEAPSNTSVGSNQFYVGSDQSYTLNLIASEEGVSVSTLESLNGNESPTAALTPGTDINLPAVSNTNTPIINVNSSPQAQTNTPGENDATNNVNLGYIDNNPTDSVSFANGTLNKTDEASTTEASMASGGIRPGEVQSDPNPFYGQVYSDVVKTTDATTNALETANLAANDLSQSYLDPILLDLTGQGVKTTSESSNPVFFDVDHSGTLKQTAWTADGNTGILVVPDANGKVTNISQLFSEYYGGTAGTGGAAGTKPFVNGFDALFSVDSNKDGKITSADSIWSSLRVWEDTNHNGKVDSGELKTLAQLGITQFNLGNSNSNTVLNGNPVTAVSSFVMNGQTLTMDDVNLIHNDATHSLVASGTGEIDTSVKTNNDGSTTTTKTYIELGSTGTTYNASAMHVNNVTGGSGNDYLLGTSTGSWLQGNGGSNTYTGGAGNDVFVVSASDNPANIHGNGGQDQIIITGTQGMTINMAQAGVEIAQGGGGDDVIMSGGRTGVYIKGGSGTDLLIGGAGNDVIVGGSGHNTIVGGTGQSLIYAGPNGDLIYGAAQSSIINAGGGEDTIIAGAGDDLIKVGMGNAQIDGGGGTNILQLHGSYGDYKIVKTTDGYVISDRIPNRDGTVFVKNIQKLNFSNIQAVPLTSAFPMPVADIVTKDKSGNAFDNAQAHTISAAALLANDQLLGSIAPLTISALKEVVGGTAQITSSGDVLFTPTAGYKGMMSFEYTVTDKNGNPAATAVDNSTGQSAPLYARVTLATPNLPTDPLITQEWYLNDTNVIPVWNDYTGAGVRIGQFEPGGSFQIDPEILNYNHPDLAPNIDKAWMDSQKLNASLPTSFSDHATLVAGVMVAAKNGTGAVGVAYDAKLAGYNISSDNTQLAYSSDYDVANNSWYNVSDFAETNLDPQTSTSAGDILLAEQHYATSYGRGGKGTIIVALAGNERQTGGSAQGTLSNNSRFAIEVGAIDQQSDLSTLSAALTPFSNPGASILVSAPGSNIVSSSQLVVTDQGSIYGSNYSTTQGTSFATPIVSGIVALMLQANPNLGYRDVQSILALSAKKFSDNSTSWNYNHDDNWNGGGMHFSYDYGFGEVDALAAVRLAETWIPHNTGINESVVSASSNSVVTINAGASTTQNLNVAAGVKVEHAEVDLSLNYGHLKDITATLISPNGTQSILLKANDPASTSTTLKYTFMSTENWGEQSTGTWQLQLQDASTGQPITLNGWALRLYGSTSSADDIYYYTNEYASQVTKFGSAATLNDAVNGTAGGKNTINAAAVTGDTSINLLTGVASIGGTGLTLQNTNNFNNIFTGDGNDTITANNNLGILDGGRGNNTLIGGTGQNLFVVEKRTGGLDTISNFSSAQSNKIDLVGFKGMTYSQLTFAQWETDVHVGLGNGQAIVLKNTSTSNINSSYFVFQDTFVAPKIYTDSSSTDNTFVGSTSTVTLHGGFLGVNAGSNNGRITTAIQGTMNQHDFATSDRFVLTSQSLSTSPYGLQGFKPGIDKLDISALGITNVSDLVAIPYGYAVVQGIALSHGVMIGSYSLGSNGNPAAVIYLESTDLTQLHASDFIFSNGQAGDPNTTINTGQSFTPNTHVPVNTTGASDPNVVGSNAGVTFNGTTSISSSVDYTLPDTVNNLILTGTNNIVGTGNNNGDTLTSNTGIDTLVGGAGNDTFIINNSNDQIIENTNAGTDSVQSSVSYQLDNNVENLTLTGTANLAGTGNALNNTITGNSGNDTLDGGLGNDTLIGGTGSNTYVFENGWGNDLITVKSKTDSVDFSAVTSNLIANMWVSSGNEVTDGTNTVNWSAGIETLYAGSGNDLLNADDGNNFLSGGAGNDTLNGNGGNDTLIGGTGNDSLSGGSGNDVYQFALGDGQDTISDSAGTDTVLFDSSILKADVALFQTSTGTLQIGYTNSSGDLISILGQNNANTAIERFQLNDGSFLTNTDVNLVIQQMSSYAVSHGASFTSLSSVENNSNLLSIVSSAWHH